MVGAKAARLGHARRLGLPVLRGFVVPASCSEFALAAAAAAMREGGPGAARLAAMEAPLDDTLRQELQELAEPLGGSLVVRSSSALEGEGRWAGAFTSYVGVTREQLEIAVRGCWASAYSRDVLERCENEAIDPASLRLAVLVQPAIDFAAGGAARVHSDGAVHVTATRGSPADLMTGWVPGEEIVVDPYDSVPADGTRVVGADGIVAVARLARQTAKLLDDDLIEWGWTPSLGALLLQSKRTNVAAERAELPFFAESAPDTPQARVALRLARLVRLFPGWLAEESILPWALLLSTGALPDGVPPAPSSPDEAREALRELGRELTAGAWKRSKDAAFRKGLEALEAVRTGNASEKLLASIEAGASLDPRAVARAIGFYRAALAQSAPARDRWEPFLFATLQRYGERRQAVSVIEGIGAGRGRFVEAPVAAPAEPDRRVLIVPQPLASFAPLLWNAAGLITIGGGAGAHLMEIARSLSVPTVMRCRVDDLVVEGADRFLFAVDGDAGCVSVIALRG